MNQELWQAAVERSRVGRPTPPIMPQQRTPDEAPVVFRGWLTMIGGVNVEGWEATDILPEVDIDYNDIQYLGIVRQWIKDPISGLNKVFACTVPMSEPHIVAPGASIKISQGFKMGEFNEDDLEKAVQESLEALFAMTDHLRH